jgi:predicted small integral membrane protein
MWQSRDWNGVPSAFRFVALIAAVLVLVAMPDAELSQAGRRR